MIIIVREEERKALAEKKHTEEVHRSKIISNYHTHISSSPFHIKIDTQSSYLFALLLLFSGQVRFYTRTCQQLRAQLDGIVATKEK